MTQSIREIKDRMRALDGAHKVIKSMKVVAIARLGPAQRRVLAYRPFATALYDMARHLSSEVGADAPLLMRRRSTFNRFDVVLITSDQGLCGSFNENLMFELMDGYREHIEHGIDVTFLVIGKKGASFLRQRSIPFLALPVKIKDPALAHMVSVEIVQLLCERFLSGECDGSYVIFNGFENARIQKVKYWNLLPLHWRGEKRSPSCYVFEPTQGETLNKLCKMTLEYTIMMALLESKAAEEATRLSAMDAASRNADEVKTELKLIYNRARQEAITMELLDIMNGVNV